jgi:hypothetical protein
MSNYKKPKFRHGIIKVKNHPIFKFGQVVTIIEETEDLYRVKIKDQTGIISKEDLVISKET